MAPLSAEATARLAARAALEKNAEDLVILILFSIVPFLVPVPMMFLGIITALLQAYIFVLLTTIYLGGAVASEHERHDHGETVAGDV